MMVLISNYIMRLVLLVTLACVVSLLAGCSDSQPAVVPEINLEVLLKVGDEMIDPSTQQPFTGAVLDYYPNGDDLRSRSMMQAGKLHGLSTGYSQEGRVEIEENFENGVSHGERKRFFADGSLASLEKIANGQFQGTTTKWHENGQMSESIPYQNGQPHGTALGWFEDGSLKTKVILDKGQVVEQKFWEQGAYFEK